MGRKYGLLKYGRSTYDKMPATWIPVPPESDAIWVPVTSPPSVDIWAGDSSSPCSRPEIWLPVTFPTFPSPP